MTPHEQNGIREYNAFRERWPIETVQTMSLSEYNQLGNRDTFSFWLERKTKTVGNISGRYSTIFEIYERQVHHVPPKKSNIKSDDKYSWYARNPGDTAELAFVGIRSKIIKIIEAASTGNFDAVEQIDGFPPLTRWKIAFMYAPLGSMVAIFAQEKLKSICKEQGIKARSLAAMHRLLVMQKPVNQGIFEYSWSLYFIKRERQYFVIGTKYDKHATESRADEMWEKQVVSTDFGPEGVSLSDLYLQEDVESLKDLLDEHDCPDLENALQNLHTFLHIRVGDIVALKSSGNPKGGKAYLGIIGYAIVVERGGVVYSYDSSLGHCLNVEYLNYNIQYDLEQGDYDRAVIKVENELAKEAIFQGLNKVSDGEVVRHIEKQVRLRRYRKGVEFIIKRETGRRNPVDSAIINYTHANIQAELFEHLKSKYPNDLIIAEEDFIDIKHISSSETRVYLYEVKPDALASRCVRQSIGQLLEYASRLENTEDVHLIIVGPSTPLEDELQYVRFVQESVKIPVFYKAWSTDFNV